MDMKKKQTQSAEEYYVKEKDKCEVRMGVSILSTLFFGLPFIATMTANALGPDFISGIENEVINTKGNMSLFAQMLKDISINFGLINFSKIVSIGTGIALIPSVYTYVINSRFRKKYGDELTKIYSIKSN
jgi:hypothetical protein